MPRLGEILVKLGYCSAEQVSEGLAAQVLYGARLGTNLVELGHINLDNLARALARRSKAPAALAGHFERRDLAIQGRLPSELAAKHHAVPLGKLAHDSDRIAVAVRDRLTEHGRGELAFALDLDPEQLVEAIAPELRLYYHLELAYQIPRANRFLRVDRDRSGVISVPPVPEAVEESDVDGQPWHSEPATPVITPVSSPSLGPVSDVEPAALDYQTAPAVDEEEGRARRRFVPKLGGSPAALARIAVRQLAPRAAAPTDHPPHLGPSPDGVLRAVRRASTRDRVATLVLDTLAALEVAPDAAALLVVRQEVAIGWKGFCVGGSLALESVAIALGTSECAIARAYQCGQPVVMDVTDAAATDLDEAVWTLLGGPPPSVAVVAPVLIADRTVCLLYAHGRGLDQAVELVPLLADAAGTAFGRLLRAAQR
ncbi:MAG: hypothetical protein R3B06_08410 [Kofleriaceae bacterium]